MFIRFLCFFLLIFQSLPLFAADSVFVKTDLSDRDDYYILGAKMKLFNLTDGFKAFPVQGQENEFYFPMSDMMNALEFPIYTNTETGISKGWFMRENRAFELNMKEGTLKADGYSIDLKSEDALWGENEIYLKTSFLKKIFPLETDINLSELTINVESLEPLPFEERLAREKRQKLLQKRKFQEFSYEDPYIETDKNFTWPFLDIGISHQRYNYVENETENTSYTISGNHLLFGLDSAFNFYGNTGSDDQYARVNLSRYRPQGDFMGFGKFFEAGDVVAYEMNLIAAPISGRGVNISTFDEKGNAVHRNLKLQGMLREGWDVEVYRNNVLMDFNQSEGTGLYQFDSLPMEMGLNKFKLIFYGPQGEIQEEERSVYLSPTSVRAGEFSYRLFAQEDIVPVFPLNDQRLIGRRAGFYFEYGLSDSFAVTSGFVLFDPVEEQPYIQERSQSRGMLGVKTGFSVFRFGLSTAWGDGSDSPALEGLAEANFSNLNFYIEHSEFNGLKTEKSYLDLYYMESLSSFQVRGRLPIPFLLSLPFSSQIKQATSITGEKYSEITHRLSLSWWRLHLSVESRQKKSFSGLKENVGVGYMNIQLGRFMLRGESRYDFDHRDLQSNSIGLDWRKSSFLTFQTRWTRTHELTGNEKDIYYGNVSRRFSFGTMSAGYSQSSEGDETFSVAYNTSILHNPVTGEIFLDESGRAQQGALVTSSYLDANYDGIYNDDEEVFSNATYEMTGSSAKLRTTDPQYTFVKGLSPYQLANVKLKDESLQDISYFPKDEKVTVMPRAGVVTEVRVPAIQLGSTEGEVKINRDKVLYPLKGMRLYLYKGEDKVAETISDAEGYYVFEKIQPGEYHIFVEEGQLNVLGMTQKKQVIFEVNPENVFQKLSVLEISQRKLR
ncbi:MAG: hypothetical protein JXR30_00655 [Alphaproteobacteria bacterium]|nr:hypothetical protein [Alphaproteobacteria bacterium]